MSPTFFATANEMSVHQHEREVQEALRVSAMNDIERFHWLEASWGRLQDEANILYANMPIQAATARHFSSMDEKNEFERNRETQFALEFQARVL